MNTQLKDRPTTDTAPEGHFSRPQPIWSGTNAPAGDPPPTTERKRTWAIIAAVAVLAAAIGAGVALLGDGPTDTPEPTISTERGAFDSPGGNSLNTVAPQPRVRVERPAFDSPGGNSVTIPPIAQSPAPRSTADRPAFDSPGGNSLNTIAPQSSAPTGFDSPGGNSLNRG